MRLRSHTRVAFRPILSLATHSPLALGLAVIIASPAFAQPIEWPVASGGNGHYYEGVYVPGGITWAEAVNAVSLREHLGQPGYLAAITSQAENDFIFDQVINNNSAWPTTGGPADPDGPWIGGVQPPGSTEPDGGWEWTSGEPFSYTNWLAGQPSNSGPEDRIHFAGEPGVRFSQWNDVRAADRVVGYVVEYPGPCPDVPDACADAGKSILLIKDRHAGGLPGASGSDRILWKWLKGVTAVTQADFADPTGDSEYGICIYDDSLAMQLTIPSNASGASWKPISDKGYRYLDPTAANDGVLKLHLQGGTPGKPKALLVAKGSNLPLAANTLPLADIAPDVIVQLRNATNGQCWESVFMPGDVKRNSVTDGKLGIFQAISK